MPSSHRTSLRFIALILCAVAFHGIRNSRLAEADMERRCGNDEDDDYGACARDRREMDDDGDACRDHDDERHRRRPDDGRTIHPPPTKYSRVCPRRHSSCGEWPSSSSSLVGHYYHHDGISAQAYKPHSPTKTSVCHTNDPGTNDNESVGVGGGGDGVWRVANWPFWRSEYDAVPLVVIGDIYGCVEVAYPPSASTTTSTPSSTSSSQVARDYVDDDDDSIISMEVWQPRPDGTYSSLRPGVEEGECRARIPVEVISTADDVVAMKEDGESSSYSNIIGHFRYETLVPGSTGLLGGLVPRGGGLDYPPYGPGGVHMYLDVRGYRPLLDSIDTSDLYDWLLPPRNDVPGRDRFRFVGWDMRPHAAKTSGNAKPSNDAGDCGGGIEIRSLTKVSRHGYDLALEVKVDVFVVHDAMGDGLVTIDPTDVFCSTRRGFLGRIRSFFKEPIAICFPSLLDFFSL
ncbi:hypothetical protein ACHAXA_006507 [Cyclostephanos tholiformis]|uniref:Uncharacterized protein n=1 Tax=Cyclostephanos tholiformis TaxID=382380 RepID=A0ABD3RZN7_9STRA